MRVAHPPLIHHHRFHINPWLVTVVALSAALVGLGAYNLSGHEEATTTAPPAAQGLSLLDMRIMLHDRRAAINEADRETVAAFYADDAVLDDRDSGNYFVGSAAVADYVCNVRDAGFLLRSIGDPVILDDRYVVEAVTLYAKDDPVRSAARGATILEIGADGKIVYEWTTELE